MVNAISAALWGNAVARSSMHFLFIERFSSLEPNQVREAPPSLQLRGALLFPLSIRFIGQLILI